MTKVILRECLRLAAKKRRALKDYPRLYRFHVSFVVQSNKVLGWGVNGGNYPWLPFTGLPDHAREHSESAAYRKVKGILDKTKNFEIVNVRLGRQLQPKISKPCPCCYTFLRELGCQRVWFTTSSGIVSMSIT
jgi:hypothetical protein